MILLSNREVLSLLQKYSVIPDKKRGQNFLKDRYIASKIVDAARISKNDRVLEIGGGLGVLSQWLARDSPKLYIIEIESGLVRMLRDVFSDQENVNIIEGDALKVEFPKVNKVVANLPYSISSEITFRILQEIDLDLAVLMYQKEFAERLVAEPGSREYSRLSVDFQYFAYAEKVMDVPSYAFYPEPSVESTVVKIRMRKTGVFAKNEEVFFKFIRGVYSYPNKQLRKALKIWLKNIGADTNQVSLVLNGTKGVSGKERLRSLNQEKLVALSDTISDLITRGRFPPL
ncbi:MAG: putative ribosomal RNA small subunit methyltransferase A [Candidatus Thorarchaeota archaeon]|nr:MAG: putative ribosomal RNA small subunit methyltransferase A [Candidatus Thorarchaeota archaeon]